MVMYDRFIEDWSLLWDKRTHTHTHIDAEYPRKILELELAEQEPRPGHHVRVTSRTQGPQGQSKELV